MMIGLDDCCENAQWAPDEENKSQLSCVCKQIYYIFVDLPTVNYLHYVQVL